MGILDVFLKKEADDGIHPQNTVNTDDIKELVAEGVVENVISDKDK